MNLVCPRSVEPRRGRYARRRFRGGAAQSPSWAGRTAWKVRPRAFCQRRVAISVSRRVEVPASCLWRSCNGYYSIPDCRKL